MNKKKLYVQNLWIKLRYSGLLRTVFDLLAKAGIRIAPFYVVQEGLLEGDIPAYESGFDEYELDYLHEEDMKALSEIPERTFTEEYLIERLRKGQVCYGVKFNGKPVCFNWFDFREFRLDVQTAVMKDDETYLFDAYTIIPFRGKKLLPYVRYQSYKELYRMGKIKLYSVSDYFNTPSIKFKKRLNAKIIKLELEVILFKKWRFIFNLQDHEKNFRYAEN